MFSEKEYLTVKHTLRFRKDGKFRILFITDLHGGVGMNPQNKPGVDAIINAANPDMVLIGGDTFGCRIGCTTPEEVREYLDLFTEVLEEKHIPWAHVYGNHDDNLGVSKEVQQEIYESYPYCVSKHGEENISGVGNYVLPVLRSDRDEVVMNIWALDSHNSMPHVDQVYWYYQTSKAIEESYGRKIPSIMYMHIPVPEYHYVVEHPEECKMTGTLTGELDPSCENSGLFTACCERGDVRAIFCGHDHLHDITGVYMGIRLSFAASCSYDAGSDNKLRGGRIIELSEETPDEINTYMLNLRDIMGLKSMSYASRSITDPENIPEKDYSIYADIFHGNGRSNLPEPEGIAKTWHFIKAICGNTNPAAILPFGKLSVGCYGGGYPTGHGNICVSSDPQGFRTQGEKNRCRGFSHMHQSGTGTIGAYYNYAVVMPCYGDIIESANAAIMKWEAGRPGFYETAFEKSNIFCYMTVSPKVACHKYKFGREGGSVVIDLSNEGIIHNLEEFHSYSMDTVIRLCGKDAFEAELLMRGITLYIYGRCEQAEDVEIWSNYRVMRGETELRLGEVHEKFGIRFCTPKKGTAELRLSISTRSMERARMEVLAEIRSFEEICVSSYKTWDNILGKIEVEAPTERDKRIFYSNLYHSLVKPSDWSGESYVYGGEGPFVTDIATIWDVYKTQIPLLFTLYADISEKLIQTFIDYCRVEGIMPHRLIVSDQYKVPDEQARMLAEHCIYDAYVRGVRADYKAALHMAEVDLMSLWSEPFFSDTCTHASHVVDIAEACGCMSELAQKLGADTALFDRYKNEWKRVFDEKTGLMIEASDYYEGSEWNFSFRPLRDMETRVAMAGGKEKFARLLDKFFGYTDQEDVTARFEGFNNESDMEAPIAYYYAGRHDRMCEVMDAGMTYMFTEGIGGLPGNNDSGALSSLYVWYAMGLFPVTGQDKLIIGTPRMNSSTLHLANGKDFIIRREGEGIYVAKAYLNGEELSDFSIKASDMMRGGTLRLIMSKESDNNILRLQ